MSYAPPQVQHIETFGGILVSAETDSGKAFVTLDIPQSCVGCGTLTPDVALKMADALREAARVAQLMLCDPE